MSIPLRILRADAQDHSKTPRFLTQKEIDCRDHIIAEGRYLMARHGSQHFTHRNLADALEITRHALRRHFPDVESLLAELITMHLRSLGAAMAEIPPDEPDAARRRRLAYMAQSRSVLGLTHAHMLYTRDRHLLPDDLLDTIETMRRLLGEMVGGPDPERTLCLLDLPCMDETAIGTFLAHVPHAAWPEKAREQEAAPEPARTPKPVQKPRRRLPELILPDYDGAPLPPLPTKLDPEERPGDWIYSCGLPGVSGIPPPR